MSPRRPAIIGLSLLFGGLAFLGVRFWLDREGPLTSDPLRPRPWAEARFLELTTRTAPSTASPKDSRFALVASPLARTGRGWEATIDLPRDEFVPDREFVEADAEGVFTASGFRGRVKCLAANFFPYDPSGRYVTPPNLRFFLPGGTPVANADLAAAGIGKDDTHLNCGWQQGYTSIVASVEVDGLAKLLARNRGFLDADTHVLLGSNAQESIRDDGFCICDMVAAVRHDARLLAVVDVAHGETRDLVIPLKAGEVAEDPEFRLRIHEVATGYIGGSSSHSESRRIEYTMDAPRSDPAPSFSLILQVDPPLKFDSVTLEALDAGGNPMGEYGTSPWILPIARFKGDLADAVSLRVRYHPKTTRLLLPLGPIPCADPANRSPKDLFDVRSTDVEFADSWQMRRFIAETTELQLINTPTDDTGAAFPIVMKSPTPREVAERYRKLSGTRTVHVDRAAMTVEFETPKSMSLWRRFADALRRRGLIP